MTRPRLKKLGLIALILAFLTLVWANRTGKFELHAYQDKGALVPVTGEIAWPPKTLSVTLGTYVQKIYNFQVQSQSFCAEGWVWLVWSQDFQDRLTAANVPVANLLDAMNLERTSNFAVTPTGDQPTRLPDGRYCQVFDFYGTFSANGLDFRRFPFETIRFPLTFGLNPEIPALNTGDIRLVPDSTRSALGESTEVPGYVLAGRQITALTYHRAIPAGLPGNQAAMDTRYSRVQMDVSYATSVISAFLQLFLPLAVVMAVVLLAPNLAGSLWDVRIALPSTALLTLIFLQQGYRTQLPSLPYLTFIDQIYTLCYATALAIFSLFVWSSNRLDLAPEHHRRAVIQQINRMDHRFQVGLTTALIVLTTLAWFFPVR